MRTDAVWCNNTGGPVSTLGSTALCSSPGVGVRGEQSFGREPTAALAGGECRTQGGGEAGRGGPAGHAPFGLGGGLRGFDEAAVNALNGAGGGSDGGRGPRGLRGPRLLTFAFAFGCAFAFGPWPGVRITATLSATRAVAEAGGASAKAAAARILHFWARVLRRLGGSTKALPSMKTLSLLRSTSHMINRIAGMSFDVSTVILPAAVKVRSIDKACLTRSRSKSGWFATSSKSRANLAGA